MLPKPTPILSETPQQVEQLFQKFKRQQEAKANLVQAQQAMEKVNTRIEQGIYTKNIGKFALFAVQLSLTRAIREYNDLHTVVQ